MTAPAFSDPVFQSQATFRAVLDAMSRPGTIVSCGEGLAPPPGLSPAAAATLLALADFETPLWLSPTFAGGEIADWLRFHTGAAFATPDRAVFALLDVAADPLDFAIFPQGSPEYPDRSTTVVLEVAELSAQGPLRLSGPGVKGEAGFGFAPLPPDFLARRRAAVATAPLGVDLILTAGRRVAALPRSTRVREAR